MTTFDTPEPICVSLELSVGDVRVTASDRLDTVVEIRATDSTRRSDVAAAEQTRVEYTNGRLLIRGPRGSHKGWWQYTFRGANDSVDVQVELPSGSSLEAEVGIATIRCSGRLGECRLKTGIGDIQISEASTVQLKTGGGDISVDRALGRAEVKTGTGTLRIGEVQGGAVIRNSNGDSWVGAVSGDLRVSSANGRISVDRAHGTVAAKTANGDICLGDVDRGSVTAQTALGRIEVGIRDGVAAWLDLNTQYGNVETNLDASARPGPGDTAVEVRARTSYGDITVHRSSANGPPPSPAGEARP